LTEYRRVTDGGIDRHSCDGKVRAMQRIARKKTQAFKAVPH